jgi:tetratricopeptide (TPR) repeat protein
LSVRPIQRQWFWLPLVLAGLLAIYLPSLGNALVFDDELLGSGALFSQYESFLRLQPRVLSYSTFVWVRDLFGEGWWKQRLLNLVIHGGVVAALWALYAEILRHIAPRADEEGEARDYARSPALGLAILFFALDPVAVYGVAYLVQRSIEMATLFVVLALWAFARGLSTRRVAWYAGAALAYAAAVASKEYAILAPLAAVPLYIVVARPSRRRLAIGALAVLAAVGAVAAVLYLRYGEILGKPFDEYSRVYLHQLAALDPSAPSRAWPLSIVNEAWLFFQYGLRWFLPFDFLLAISLRPAFPTSLAAFPQVLGVAGYLALLAGGFFLVLRYRDWRALVGLSLLFPVLLYPTEFATVWVQDPFVLYRSYLWAIGVPGIVFCLVHGAPWRATVAVAVGVTALFAWGGLDRVFSLATPESAWSDAIEKLPRDPRAVGRFFPYINRGSEYVGRNDFEAALQDFQASERLGDMGMGAFNTGAVLAARGEHPEALAAFDRAQAQGYDLWNLPFQRALSLRAMGRLHDAVGQFVLARQFLTAVDPADVPSSDGRHAILLELGRTALAANEPAVALDALKALHEDEPHDKQGRFLLAMAMVSTHDYAGAKALLDPLVKDDGSAPAYYARALANNGLQRKAEALADIDAAIQRDPRNAALRQWRERIAAAP